MDRAFASGAKGRRFESCQAHQPQVFQEVAWLLDRYHMLTTVCDKSKRSQVRILPGAPTPSFSRGCVVARSVPHVDDRLRQEQRVPDHECLSEPSNAGHLLLLRKSCLNAEELSVSFNTSNVARHSMDSLRRPAQECSSSSEPDDLHRVKVPRQAIGC